MSLLRLLTAGRSLVGMNQSGSRYQVTNRRLLPKFGSARNPLRSVTSRAFCAQAAEVGEAATQRSLLPAEAQPAESLGGTQSSEVPQSIPMAEPLSNSMPLSNGEGEGKGTETSTSPVLRPDRPPGLLIRWTRAVTSRFFQKRPGAAKPGIPNFAKTPVQCELSLDRVKVVRNDLSDADLEVVPAKKPAATARVPETGKRCPQPRAEETGVAAPQKVAQSELAGATQGRLGLRQFEASKF